MIVLTRTELHQRIWATSMLRLAREFGISDVALAKHCRRRNVPRPPRGYWARLAAGQAVTPAPLPPPAGPDEDRPVLLREPKRKGGAEKAPRSRERESVARRGEAALHPIADRVKKNLLLSKPSACGRVRLEQPGLPRVIASPQQAGSVADAVHALIARAQSMQIDAVPGDREPAPLEFRRGKHTAHLLIEEELRTRADRTQVPSGRLTFQIAIRWKHPADVYLDQLLDAIMLQMDSILR